MNSEKKYELVVAGGGSAGSIAAKWAVQHGISVALVERHMRETADLTAWSERPKLLKRVIMLPIPNSICGSSR